MSTPIPAFATQVIATDQTVQVTTGTVQALPTSRWYYFISNRSTASNGQSLIYQLNVMLNASLAGTTWTVILVKVAGVFKIQLSHNNGSPRTVTFSASFAAQLGFSSASFAVGASTLVVAANPSAWWWTPDMPISLTGPKMFDPSISYGVQESAGASQRAPDMTAAYVRNGSQWSAEYTFMMVQGYYLVWPVSGYTNRDLTTWWQSGPQLGRRFLLYRDRENTTGLSAPGGYYEYTPQETLRGVFPADASFPNNLVYWDVKLDCWITENGGTEMSA